MKKLNLVGLNKRDELEKKQLHRIRGGGTCLCNCYCTYATPASEHNADDHTKSGVKDSADGLPPV